MEFLVDIDRIPTKGLSLEGEISFEDLRPLLSEQWVGFDGTLSLTILIEVRGDGVFARGEFRATALAACSRCAADVAFDLHNTFVAAYAPEGKKDVQFEDGVLFDISKPPVWYPLPADKIDLLEPFEEALVFALPNYPRCQDDCEIPEKWRAPDPDAESNTIDPRFQKLLEIREAMAAEPATTEKTSTKNTNSGPQSAAGETRNDKKKG